MADPTEPVSTSVPSRRGVLGRVLITLAIAGLIGVAWLLVRTWSPSERVTRQVADLTVRDLQFNEVRTFEGRFARLYVLRSFDGWATVLRVPLKDGHVLMPDRHWYRPFYACRNFGPELTDGRLRPQGVFRCFDADAPSNWLPHWRWDYRGRNVSSEHFDDMFGVRQEWRDWTVSVYDWDTPL